MTTDVAKRSPTDICPDNSVAATQSHRHKKKTKTKKTVTTRALQNAVPQTSKKSVTTRALQHRRSLTRHQRNQSRCNTQSHRHQKKSVPTRTFPTRSGGRKTQARRWGLDGRERVVWVGCHFDKVAGKQYKFAPRRRSCCW